ncbi:hypothetical protein [Williamsia muralis]|uniref:Uncharacterized protein n=1 Tax=Williamsia marianensis TaxID=85044 RepID=A0A2G3PT07_WILMA|nr:hypothetical protein [Williamsia marianensis]PHV68192.1 hypothetical protein CSW57_02795 [Williamsia marianensis]
MLLVSAVTVATLLGSGVAGAEEPTFPFDLPGAGSSDSGSTDSGSTDPENPTPDPNTPGSTGPGGLQLLSPNAGEPVLGVPIETLSDNPSASIIVGGEGMPFAADRQNLLIAVLDARTRARLESGTAPNFVGGVRQLAAIADSYRNRNDTIIIVSGHRGITNASREPAVGDLLRALGASPISGNDLNRMEAGAPFSIIGKTGAPEGTAYTRVGVDVGDRAGANITGLLRWSAAGQRYDFTPPAPLPFTTGQEATGGPTVTMTIGGASYPSTPSGSDGFVIRGFDSQTLEPAYSATVVTNNDAGNRDLSARLVAAANEVDAGGRPLLVVIQSFGRPKPTGAWHDGADAIVRLGGSRLSFLSLNGTSDYTLVGGTAAGSSVVERGAILGKPGPAMGLIARSHDSSFLPLQSGPLGGVDLRQNAIMYQPSYQGGSDRAPNFPPINAAAEAYIGSKANVPGCTSPTAATCNVREKYRTNYNAAWTSIKQDLATSVTMPTDGASYPFTAAEFNAALTQLRTEVTSFVAVKTYYDNSQKSMGLVGTDAKLSVTQIGDAIVREVSPPAGSTTFADGVQLTNVMMNVVGLVIPELKTVWGPISTLLGLTAYTSAASDRNAMSLANKTRVRVDQLSRQVNDSLTASTYAFTTVALIMASDYGKLQAANAEISAEHWVAPTEPGQLLNDLKTGLRTWFTTTLVPITYPWLIRGTPPPLGPGDVNGLSCGEPAGFGRLIQRHPWTRMPRNAQMRATWSFDGNGPMLWNMFFTRERPEVDNDDQYKDIITPGIANMMFGNGADQLNINLYDFMSPRHFGPIMHQANDAALFCDLY